MLRDIGYLLFIIAVAICAFAILAPAHSAAQPAQPLVQVQRHDQAQANKNTASRGVSTVTGKPSLSAQFMNTILCTFRSPTCGKGQALYQLGVKYGIDPAYALAFFLNESTFGRAGMARVTLALGNERCINDRPCINNQGGPCQAGQSCYAQFESWEDGFEHWYMLIRNLYIWQWHLSTVEAIIPVYAPAADHNVPAHYIAVVKAAVQLWRAGKVALP